MVATRKGIAEYGLRSLEIFYLPIKDIRHDGNIAYVTQLRINDPDMGVVIDDAFMPVAERTVISEKITSWLIENLFMDMERFLNREIEAQWYSIYIPIRILTKLSFMEEFFDTAKQKNYDLSKLCFAFNNKILYEDHNVMTGLFARLKLEGMKTMITDFGDSFSPINRIADIKPDYVFLNESVVDSLTSDNMDKKALALNLYDVLNKIDVRVITPSVDEDKVLELIPEEHTLYSGKLVGGYRKARSVR